MYKQKRPITHQHFRIFVAGIPSGVSAKLVKSYFDSFGPVADIVEVRKRLNDCLQTRRRQRGVRKGENQGGIDSGVCCLYTPCEATYHAILDTADHALNGRSIMCSPFKSKRTAIQENMQNNRKRVLIKRVPSTVPESSLRESLESVFGPVAVFFSFLPELHSRSQAKSAKQQQRLFKTYSVMFDAETSANKAILAGHLCLSDGATLVIEAFQIGYKAAKQTTATAVPPTAASVSDQSHASLSLSEKSATNTARGKSKQHCLPDVTHLPTTTPTSVDCLPVLPENTLIECLSTLAPVRTLSASMSSPTLAEGCIARITTTAFHMPIPQRRPASAEPAICFRAGYRSPTRLAICILSAHLKRCRRDHPTAC